ncbi:MAG TPA: hypothetical protein VK966_01180, partial [Longimicrobiales bacterium]|nr:hypothetical protein [Longimicrobiales bacterium]
GAARAAVAALLEERADAVHVLNRNPQRAAALTASLDPAGRRVSALPDASSLRREGYDLVVNGTPLGLQVDDPPPLDLSEPARVGAVLDLTYRPEGTAWVRDARGRGIPAADGTEMLLRQGAAAFQRWFGTEPSLDVMRTALYGSG